MEFFFFFFFFSFFFSKINFFFKKPLKKVTQNNPNTIQPPPKTPLKHPKSSPGPENSVQTRKFALKTVQNRYLKRATHPGWHGAAQDRQILGRQGAAV
jgi:hypothetical protein